MTKQSNDRIYNIGVALAGSPAGGWFMTTIAPPIDRLLLRLSGGRVSLAVGFPVLVLTTTGAKTGQQRTTPLVYVRDGERVILVASNGGNQRHPGWYHNLRANPQVTLTINGRTSAYTAHEAEGEERDRLWRKAAALYAGYDAYKQRANKRTIPVLVLTPQA